MKTMGTEGNREEPNLTNQCQLMTEHGLGGIMRRQALTRCTMGRKLETVMEHHKRKTVNGRL